MQTLLSKYSKEDLRLDPFPHLIVKDPVSPEVANRLIREMPPLSTLTKGREFGNNKRFDFTVSDIRNFGGVSQFWKEFIESQSSPEFWSDFVRIFGDSIMQYYPELVFKYGEPSEWSVGRRYIDNFSEKDVIIDAHISVNTPVLRKPSSVRELHVDDPKKIYSGLFYLRADDDMSKGGDLFVYKYKDKKKRKFYGQGIDDKYASAVGYVPYEKNVLIIFLNHLDSLHGVSPREVTDNPRYFVNLVGEMEAPIFDLVSNQENIWKRRVRSFINEYFKEPHA